MGVSLSESRCVHLIDDEEALRQTLSFMLSSGGFFTRVYASAAEFLDQISQAPSGCILTDVRMPGISGLDLVRQVMETDNRFCVVVMSGYADIPVAVEAMKLGASDFLQKPFGRDTLVATITGALDRAPKLQPRPSPESARDSHRDRFSSLTPRQRDVLRGILDGKLNKVIAHDLGLSVRTVESYRTEIIAKTQVNSLSELVRIAVLAGM